MAISVKYQQETPHRVGDIVYSATVKYDVFDDKNRQLGYCVRVFKYQDEHLWRLCPQQLRNGKPYGACQHDTLHASVEAAMAAGQVLVNKRAKDYAKKWKGESAAAHPAGDEAGAPRAGVAGS